jgi:hypothetical protein
MTEAERAERLRKLQERRSSSGRAAATQTSRADTTRQLTDDRTTQIPRLEERPVTGTRSLDDTRPLAGLPDTDRIGASPIFSARQTDSIDRPKRARRSHKAEASRIASAGAGIALTFSLMSSMAGADAVAETAADQSTGDPIATTATIADQPPATTPMPSALSAATPQGPVPVVLAPIQVRTRIVVENSGGNGGGAQAASNGNTPQPGGSATVASPQPAAPPPPPPETTKSNGSN